MPMMPVLEQPLNTAVIGSTLSLLDFEIAGTSAGDLAELVSWEPNHRGRLRLPPRARQQLLVLDASAFGQESRPDAFRIELLETTRLESELQRDLEDAMISAREMGELGPTRHAVELCMKLARRLVPFVIGHTGLQIAGFDNENGEASLVMQSNTTNRRITFEFSADGARITEYRTDETSLVVETRYTANGAILIGEMAAWVTGNL